jgi:hypothetical protein
LIFGNFITEKENQCTRFYPGDFVAARAAKWLALVSSGQGNNLRSKPGSGQGNLLGNIIFRRWDRTALAAIENSRLASYAARYRDDLQWS